jgi:hypothetical protein
MNQTMNLIDSLKCPCKGEAFRQVCPGCATIGCVHCIIINGLCVDCRVIIAFSLNSSSVKTEPTVIDISESETESNYTSEIESDYTSEIESEVETEDVSSSDYETVTEIDENEEEVNEEEVVERIITRNIYPKPLRKQILEVFNEATDREWLNVKEITNLRPDEWWSTKEEIKHRGVAKGVYMLYKVYESLTRKKENGVFYYKLKEQEEEEDKENNPNQVNINNNNTPNKRCYNCRKSLSYANDVYCSTCEHY